MAKHLFANERDAGDGGSFPGSGRSLGEGNGSLLEYSCLENSMDRGAWQAIVHGLTKSWMLLSTSFTVVPELFQPTVPQSSSSVLVTGLFLFSIFS